MTLNQKKESDIILEKKNTLMQLWISMKQSIFDVLFVVLDKAVAQAGHITIMSLMYESGIDYLQMMQFPFNFTIILVWNGGQTLNSVFQFLSTVVSINTLMPSINYNAFLIMLYLVIFLIILVIIDIIYVSYSFTKKKFRFTLPLVLLAQIVPLFVTFLFIPVFEFLLNVINCSPSATDPNITVMQFFPNIQCFAGTHIIHASITLFFTALFVFISTVVAMTLFEPRITGNTIASRRSSDGQIIFIVNKIVCQFFLSLTPFSQTWPYIFLMFFPALWLFYFYQYKQPYYNKNVGKLYRIFSSYYFWTVLMLTISQIGLLLNFNFQGSMVIWFCGLPFIALSIAYQTKSNIDNLFSSNLKFKTGEQLELHMNYVLQLLNNRKDDENSNMLLVGYIQKHIETCVEDDCPIKVKKKKKEQFLKEMDQNCKLLIHQIQRMYNQGIKKFPQSTKLHISFAFFYMEQIHQNAKAYEEFVRAERLSPSFIEEFIIYRFKKIIKDKLEQNKKQENDLIQIIRFDNHVTLCQQAMIQSAKLHKQFWTELVQETPNLQKMNEIGSRIIDAGNSVKFNFQQIKKINSHSAQIIHNYGVYSMFVSQNILEGKQCLAQSKRAYFQKLSKQDMIAGPQSNDKNQENFSIIVNAAENSMGKIMTVSEGFIEMSGYLKEEITEKSIDKILPQIMTFYHEYVMNKWLLDSKRQYMNDQSNSYFKETHRGFIKQKNGFIIPVHYKVSYNIMQQKFYVFFKNDKELGENLDLKIYIITDNKGVIKEISSLGFAYFNFTRENMSSNPRYIDQFGINYLSDLYNEDGNYLKIQRHATVKRLQALERIEGMDSKELKEKPCAQFSLDCKKEASEEFFVKAERIMMPYQGDDFEDQEEDYSNKLKNNGKKDIGTIFILQRMVQPKIVEGQVRLDSLNIMGQQILQLYEANQNYNGDSQQELDNPLRQPKRRRKSRVQSAVEQLKLSENSTVKQRTFHNFSGRIKTYRLINKQFKRIAEQYGDEQSDYDEVDEQKIALSAFEIQKLKNPLFVQKIKEAINTNIDHRQVAILKVTFSVFLIGLIGILILNYLQVNKDLGSIQSLMDQNILWVKDQFFMCNMLHLAFNSTQNATGIYSSNSNYTLEYNITFDPDVQVIHFQQDGSQTIVRLNQAMILIQGQMINYFNNNTLAIDTDLMLKNYYLAVYPALQNFKPVLNVSYTPTLLYLGAMVTLASIVVAFWIYNIMKIDLKCFDIILWFLDIPVAYVSYLQVNCNTFLKTHIPVKQLMEKGINFHDKNLYIEEYSAFEAKANEQDDKFNQDNKARKILIARYKKRTFLSHCDCGYLQLFWLLLYSLAFSLTYFLTLKNQIDFFTFMNQQWKIASNQFLWSAMIPNNLRLMIQQDVQLIGSLDLVKFENNLENKFLNPVSTANLTNTYSKLISYGSSITTSYLEIFQGNICSFSVYSLQSTIICKNYLSGKLEGGISSVFAYYSMIDHSQYLQVEHVQYDYINTYLMRLFETWSSAFYSSNSSVSNIITLCLVLYIIFSVLGFILLWFLYLQKLNVRLNETIQMLNMIPIRMLPKGRKDIRDFFNWIIREANKYQVEN